MGKIIWYFGGGNMRSVYGAGIAKGISDKMSLPELFTHTREFVVGSGGAINVAGLVAGQAEIPGRVCMEDLQEGFVSYYGAINRIAKGFGRKMGLNLEVNSSPNCVNIDYLMDVLENKRKLDEKGIKYCPVPIMMKLFDVKGEKIIYKDIREEPMKIIKQGVSIVPYYSFGGNLVDGEGLEPLGIKYLLSKKKKGDKIVVVMNYPPFNDTKHRLKSWLEENVAEGISPIFAKWFREKDGKFAREIEEIKALEGEDFMFVYPNENDCTRSRTTDRKKLMKTYEMGKRDSEKIVNFIRDIKN